MHGVLVRRREKKEERVRRKFMAVKVLERMLLPELNTHFTPAEHQHGFRRDRSTITALLPLVTRIADGFKQPTPPRRSTVVALDISKAFDRVNLSILLDEIVQTTLHHNIVRWLRAYLSGRSATCDYNSVQSSFKKVHGRLNETKETLIAPA